MKATFGTPRTLKQLLSSRSLCWRMRLRYPYNFVAGSASSNRARSSGEALPCCPMAPEYTETLYFFLQQRDLIGLLSACSFCSLVWGTEGLHTPGVQSLRWVISYGQAYRIPYYGPYYVRTAPYWTNPPRLGLSFLSHAPCEETRVNSICLRLLDESQGILATMRKRLRLRRR